MPIENITNKLLAMDFVFTNAELVEISVVFIGASVLIILIGLIFYFIKNRKTKEEKVASKILKKVNLIENGKTVPKEEIESETKNMDSLQETKKEEKVKNGFFSRAKKTNETKEEKPKASPEISLKEMLVKKFQPIIENQLKTDIEIKNFEVLGNDFKAQIFVQGNNLELILDSSGKIIDYKKI